MKTLNKFRGCLVGGAVGDALGYAVEFMQDSFIRERYGENGITEYSLDDEGKAIISDDTQMTLFTAEGLLLCSQDPFVKDTKEGYRKHIWKAYKRWFLTQVWNDVAANDEESWLLSLPELYECRAPGITCLSALSEELNSTFENPVNNSKGCGGVMRVAPVGLFLDEKKHSIEEIDLIGAEASLLTHGHELGYIPAAALVHIVHMAVKHEELSLIEIVEDSLIMMTKIFPDAEYLQDFLDIMNLALHLAECRVDDYEAIKELGEGWVAEEALAIAVFCAVKYADDFEKAMIASVNHSGDSDSTGAITGNILGAYLGIQEIPEKYLTNLELKDEIVKMADMLWENK